MANKISSMFAFGILILASTACNFSFSTANLSDVKFGKDKTAGSPATSFKPDDEIFAVTAVNGAISNNKVKFRVLFDKVEGAANGAVAYKIERELPVAGNGAVAFNFSLPGGFVSGAYQAEFVLVNEDGRELDRKIGKFTIEGASKSSKTVQPNADQTGGETVESHDKDAEDK